MEIYRSEKRSARRTIAVTAAVFVLLIAGATGAGMLVFSPSANAWPIAAFGQWNPDGREIEKLKLGAGSLADNTLASADASIRTEGASLTAKMKSFLKDDAPKVDSAALAGAATAFASEGNGESTGDGEGGTTAANANDSDVVLQVTQQDVDQAMAAGEEAVGFWRWLWDKLWGAMKAVAETVVTAVT